MFKSKQRIQSAWAKGLMFGKAVGARDERERIIALLQARHESILDYLGLDPEVFDKSDYFTEIVEVIMEGKND